MITHEEGRALLSTARSSISEALGAQPVPMPELPMLHARCSCFVTLHRHGRLHGCIGSFEVRSLGDAVRHNAYAAAFEDPRARPLELVDVDELDVEISLLSARTPIFFESEEHARDQLRPGIDGLLLQWGPYRGVFLPQVWDSLPRARDFLDQLKVKAGLPTDFWSAELTIERFTVEKLVDPAPVDARARREIGY